MVLAPGAEGSRRVVRCTGSQGEVFLTTTWRRKCTMGRTGVWRFEWFLIPLTPVDNVFCWFRLRCAFRISSTRKEVLPSPPAVPPSFYRLQEATTKPTRALHANNDNTWIAILLFPSQFILRRTEGRMISIRAATKRAEPNRGLSGTSQWERVSSARAGFDFTSSNLEYDDVGSSDLQRKMLVVLPEALIAIRLARDDCQDAQPCRVGVGGQRGCRHVC